MKRWIVRSLFIGTALFLVVALVISFERHAPMGFFSSLFGTSKQIPVSRYVTEEAFRKNFANQTRMAPLTLAQLRKLGVTDSMMLKLEFFFYTNSEPKAKQLSDTLLDFKYEVSAKKSAKDPSEICVTGWTTPMKMDDATVTAWTAKMCQLGFDNDCEFDGWGTNAP